MLNSVEVRIRQFYKQVKSVDLRGKKDSKSFGSAGKSHINSNKSIFIQAIVYASNVHFCNKK